MLRRIGDDSREFTEIHSNVAMFSCLYIYIVLVAYVPQVAGKVGSGVVSLNQREVMIW